MAFFSDYTVTSPVIPDGLHARNDFEELPTSTPPHPFASQSPLLPFAPSSYDWYHTLHDADHSAHTELMRDQLYADLRADLHAELHAELHADFHANLRANLQALLADLEPQHSRVGRTTWGRTKNYLLGSIKRALSSKSRRKSQHSEPESKPAGESQSLSSAGEPPAVGPVEVSATPAPISELAAPILGPYHPYLSSDQAAATAPFPFSSNYHSDVTGYGHLGYNASYSMGPLFHQSQVGGPHPHELATSAPNANLHATPWYPHPAPSLTAVSALSPSAPSTRGSHWLVSPQSSISSDSSQYTSETAVVRPEWPIFAEETTSSPVEYGEKDDEVAPWDRYPVAAQHGSWDSTTTAVELADNSFESLAKPAQWLQNPSFGMVSELEGFVPPTKAPTSSFPQQPCAPERWELPAAAVVQPGLDRDRRQSSQGIMGKKTAIANSGLTWACFSAQHVHPLTRPAAPQPLAFPTRHNSVSSIASTVFDVRLLDDDRDAKAAAPAGCLSGPQGFEELPSQQQAAAKRSSPVRRKRTPEEPVCCPVCNYHPKKGPGLRRKMEKHCRTDKHRKAMEQDMVGKIFLCCRCPSMFNRADNLVQHLRKQHNLRPSDRGQAMKALEQSLRFLV